MAKAGKPISEGGGLDRSNRAVQAFTEEFRGDLIFPDEDDYDEVRSVWNGTINRYPAVIARCTGVADVVAAIDFARDNELLTAVRGGAHNVSGNATCDGGIVIDLSELNSVYVDPEEQTARVEGGAKWVDVDRETQLFGLATPGGAVSDTGVSGFTLNGGYGHLRRKHGLACDNLRSVDLVTADGEFRTASDEQHEDLFWAIRGGGGNFGVVTSMEFDLYQVGPELEVAFVWYPREQIDEGLRTFRTVSESAPDELSVLAFTAFVPEVEEFPEERWGELALAFLGASVAGADDGSASAELQKLRNIDEPIVDFSGPMEYTDLQELLDEDYPTGRYYYWKSVYLDELTDDLIDLIESTSTESPSPLSTVDLWQLGGAIDERSRDATAFWHRNHPYMLNYEANWDDPEESDENIAWARESIDAVRERSLSSGGYGNFAGFNEDPARTVFGENLDRLREVKTTYDPTNLFRLNQNVEPEPEP